MKVKYLKHLLSAAILGGVLTASPTLQAGNTVLWTGFDNAAYTDQEFINSYGYEFSKQWPWGGYKSNDAGVTVYHPTENVWVDSGTLKIKAYTSDQGWLYGGAVSTGYWKKTIKYGQVEGRIKAPYAYGYCPSFWLIPSDGSWPPEIDIFEFPGKKVDGGKKLMFSSHWGTSANHGNLGLELPRGGGSKWTGNFFYYRLNWLADRLELYVDNSLQNTIWENSENRVPDKNMDVVSSIEVALGGDSWAGWPAWNSTALMEVDSPSMYQKLMGVKYLKSGWARFRAQPFR